MNSRLTSAIDWEKAAAPIAIGTAAMTNRTTKFVVNPSRAWPTEDPASARSSGARVVLLSTQAPNAVLKAIALSAVLRGSYHLYQGFGGFLGNAIMGLIFGWWFLRTRRVWPLIVAHSVIDAVSFIGYVYLHNRYSWI